MSDERELTDEQQTMARRIFGSMPLVRMLGMNLDDLRLDEATVSLAVRDELHHPGGLMHGGVTATLIDTAMAFAVRTRVGPTDPTATIDLTIHYIRPHSEGEAICTARVVRAGKRIFTVTAEVKDHDGRVTATAVSAYTKI